MSKLITERKYSFTLPAGKKKERLDVFLTGAMENATRTRIQKLIDAGCVTVNQTTPKANYQVKPSDLIEVTIPVSPRPETLEGEDIPLNIIYEDDYFLIINKPPDMVVHPSLGHFTGTLVNALLFYSDQLSESNDEDARPGIVHRIDKDTSGLLVVAKDEVTHAELSKQFFHHTIEREYWAIVWGKFKEPEGVIRSYITRSKKDRKKFTMSEADGKHAVTHYRVLKEFDFLTLVALNLETGRTHQIRVHMAGTGHPIFGDETYGGRVIHTGVQYPKLRARVENLLEMIPRQALHAKTLGFIHPHTRQPIRFESELPYDMQTILDEIEIPEDVE
ncbi:MAG: RluA family pseudouridine synthase [Ignavibacteria bacterium]|nr:RluA family pseudouridine synthase [Ignavibacteria bacterium]